MGESDTVFISSYSSKELPIPRHECWLFVHIMPAHSTVHPKISHEVLQRDFELWEQELNYLPVLQRRLGGFAIESSSAVNQHNHDPLAHVWQLSTAGSLSTELLTKFKTEFISDMGERSPDNGFYHVFSMRLDGSDLVSSTGVSMRISLASSVNATRKDAMRDRMREYGLRRELIQHDQIHQIIDWANNPNGSRYFGYVSLCPPAEEVSSEIAKANGFKPDRLMASLWIYERTGDDLTMHALSLDHCTLGRLQRLLDRCGLKHTVKSTTIDQLANALSFDGPEIEELRRVWSEILHEDMIDDSSLGCEANSVVESRPEAFRVYMKFVVDVTASLGAGRVNKNLSNLIKLARQSDGSANAAILGLRRFRKFDTGDARALMEFVRSRMIPHYIYGQTIDDGLYGSEGDVLSASGSSASRIEAYGGACPSSSFESQTSEIGTMSIAGLINRQLVINSLLESGRIGNCMACGVEKTSVYGCGLCGRCNKIWCDEYKLTGKGLEIKDVKKIVTPKPNRKTAIPAKKATLFRK